MRSIGPLRNRTGQAAHMCNQVARLRTLVPLVVLYLLLSDVGGAQQTAPAVKESFTSAGVNWAPPDIDVAVPPLQSETSCPLHAVIEQASKRVQEMVSNLLKFSATERVEHFELASDGKWKSEKPLTFEYLVEMREVRKGMLVMEETRDDELSAAGRFPAGLATLGLPALALVFHPYLADEYEMKCEGLGKFEGYDAWLVRFQQRPDTPPRLRAYRIKQRVHPLKIKGRAWIAADNFQVLHMETDLLEPVPQIRLAREHLAVDYRPVHFRRADEELWLQQRAEVFMDFRGRRYRRLHAFTDFKLFTVDTEQKVRLPKDP